VSCFDHPSQRDACLCLNESIIAAVTCSDSKAAQHRPVASRRCARRTLCHFASCHPDTRRAVRPSDIDRDSLER
jgi:hypothetical protein